MADDMQQLELWAAPLIARLVPSSRSAVARAIARDLRRAQAQRIAAQIDPEGDPYTPRRTQTRSLRSKKGAIRRKQGAMFAKLRTAKWLKAKATAEGAEVGFFGRVARLAWVHQEGLSDRVAPGGPMVKYPRRALFGFSPSDRETIHQKLVGYLTEGRY